MQTDTIVTSSIVVNAHLSISVMVSSAGQGHGFVKGILETGGVMDKCVQMWTRNYGALGQTARVCFGVGQVCPDVDKELWRLGPDGSGDRGKKEKRGEEKGQGSPGEGTDGRRRRDGKERERRRKESRGESGARLEWRKGLSPKLE
ncbi:hypothetical protein TNCV_1397591 [Trichonephila clavipes]|nr:hypothetical protein TNCV_1397591 [Trichonephila clavipes]